jgi:3-hydroxyisobutyrate dehydrogenase-like beta-hydroxyacid dehydrogenase
VKAGRLSFACPGPNARSTPAALPRDDRPAASYVGEGELARIVKICHNVFLGVVTQSLAEITVLAQKAGVPRHAFLDVHEPERDGLDLLALQDAGVREPRLQGDVHAALLRKDMDLGLDAGGASRCRCRSPPHARPHPVAHRRGWTEQDFATLLLQQAQASGMELKPENVEVGDGLT